MSNLTLQKGQQWQNRNDGLVHFVLEVSAQDGVVTFSENAPEYLAKEGVAGYSWLGPISQFLAEFIPLPSSTQGTA